ncbi:MAG: DUF5698 domain-containing protein, partial [Candidatus Hadarchaeota archaeon]
IRSDEALIHWQLYLRVLYNFLPNQDHLMLAAGGLIMEIIFWSILIFLARLVDVSMGTMRMILLVRGRRGIASISSFFEMMIWIVAVSRVITQLDNWYYIFAFALGFASGNFLGSYIEEKIALGYMFAYIVPKNHTKDLADELRKAGFGVTVVPGRGLKGPEMVHNVFFKRRDINKLMGIVKKHGSFFTMIDVRTERGGYFGGARKGK